MSIKVRFFARMRDELGRSGDTVEYQPGMTVAAVWNATAGDKSMPEGVLVAVNMEHVKGNPQVNDGDEVAFFPPVTGG